MNIFEFAMKMELDGKAYYEKLASESEVTALKTIFSNLAADEEKHFETFKALKTGLTANFTESRDLDLHKDLFEKLIANRHKGEFLFHSSDGYRLGMEIEAEMEKFYTEEAQKENNPGNAKLLLRIAEEERDHHKILENLYQFALAPQYFLAWGEFSNLKEL